MTKSIIEALLHIMREFKDIAHEAIDERRVIAFDNGNFDDAFNNGLDAGQRLLATEIRSFIKDVSINE